MKESWKLTVATEEKEDTEKFPDAEGTHLSEGQRNDLRSLLFKVSAQHKS